MATLPSLIVFDVGSALISKTNLPDARYLLEFMAISIIEHGWT